MKLAIVRSRADGKAVRTSFDVSKADAMEALKAAKLLYPEWTKLELTIVRTEGA